MDMVEKNLKSPDFVNLCDQEFKKMILSRKRGNDNFYRYAYSLIENHIKNREYKHAMHTLQDHSYDLAVMIPGKVNFEAS